MADSNNIKTPLTRFLNLHHSDVKKSPLDHPREGLRLEAHQLYKPAEEMGKSAASCKSNEPKKRRPCQEAGIFPIKNVQPVSTSLSGCIGGNKICVQATKPISLSPGNKLGLRPKALSFKINSSTSAFASRLQHPSSLTIQQPASSMDHYRLPDNCLPVTSKNREKKSRIPISIARVKQERTIKMGKRKQERIAALEKRKQELTEELISVGSELNRLNNLSQETTPTAHKDVPKTCSPFFISDSPMPLTPIVLNVSPAPLLNAAESKNVNCLYENYRRTCTYLRTPQRFSCKRRRRGTIQLQLERLFQD